MEITSFLKLLSRFDGFGCGFFVFGCFSQILSFVVLCCLLALGLKFLHFKCLPSLFVSPKIQCCSSFDREHKEDCSNNGFVSKSCLVDGLDKKKKPIVLQWSSDSTNGSSCENCDHLLLRDGTDHGKNRDGTAASSETEVDEGEVSEEEESQSRSDEDQVFDVITLREMVKKERRRGEFLKIELEKERRAAESAAEEAMALLLKLRMEKNAVEMEAKQYKRIAEQKQLYDQEVIQSLQWMLMKLDDEDNDSRLNSSSSV